MSSVSCQVGRSLGWVPEPHSLREDTMPVFMPLWSFSWADAVLPPGCVPHRAGHRGGQVEQNAPTPKELLKGAGGRHLTLPYFFWFVNASKWLCVCVTLWTLLGESKCLNLFLSVSGLTQRKHSINIFFYLNISRACTLKVGAEFCFIAPSY